MVPMIVEKSVAKNPILIEFPSAVQISGAPQGFCQFAKVNPFQTRLLFAESLNENANVYATGIKRYVKATTA
jgi:hypothetical protein